MAADESRGTRNNVRQAQAYEDEQGRRRVDRDGSRQQAAANAQPVTRGEVLAMIREAFQALNITGDGVSGAGQQWAINQEPRTFTLKIACDDVTGEITVNGTVQ